MKPQPMKTCGMQANTAEEEIYSFKMPVLKIKKAHNQYCHLAG